MPLFGFPIRVQALMTVTTGPNPSGCVHWTFSNRDPEFSDDGLQIALACYYYVRALNLCGPFARGAEAQRVADRHADALHRLVQRAAARMDPGGELGNLPESARVALLKLAEVVRLAPPDEVDAAPDAVTYSAALGIAKNRLSPAILDFKLSSESKGVVAFNPASTLLLLADLRRRFGDSGSSVRLAAALTGVGLRLQQLGKLRLGTNEATAADAGLRAVGFWPLE